MKVFPVPGRLVRDPGTHLELGSKGLDVSDTDGFWRRRINDGDVTLKAPRKPTALSAEQSAKARKPATKKGGN